MTLVTGSGATGCWHVPPPSQAAGGGQPGRSVWPAGTGEQIPTRPGRFAEKHTCAHAVFEHTPSAQLPDVHSEGALHATPFGFVVTTQAPFTQDWAAEHATHALPLLPHAVTVETTHTLLLQQPVGHVVELQSGALQAPAPSQNCPGPQDVPLPGYWQDTPLGAGVPPQGPDPQLRPAEMQRMLPSLACSQRLLMQLMLVVQRAPGPDCGATQIPLEHGCPEAQAVLQLPQCVGSFIVSTHLPPQLTVPIGHTTPHWPFRHMLPFVHALPHWPQFRLSLARFTQALPHTVVPPVQLKAHWPLEQTCPGWQTLPQTPQFFVSAPRLSMFTTPADAMPPVVTTTPERVALAPPADSTTMS